MTKSGNRTTASKREHSPVVANPAKKARTASPASTLNSQPDEGKEINDSHDNEFGSQNTATLTRSTPTDLNTNPYRDVANNLVQLTRVNDYLKSRDIPEQVPTVDIAAMYRNNYPIISTSRVMHIAFAPSKDCLTNLALIDPDDYSVHSERVVRATVVPRSFFMLGSVVYSDLFGLSTAKQICIQPLHFLWPRTAAAIGHVFEVGPKKVLMNNGYRRGLSFTSWLKSSETSTATPDIPVNGKRHGPAIRPRDQPVPVFDCRGPFKLSSYHTCPADNVDPENGSIVLIIFTLGRYKELGYNVVSYNVQVVLRLADTPSDDDGKKPVVPLPAYLTSLEPVGVIGVSETENVFIDDGEDDSTENVY
ncbi:hypothetical protein IW261DRAFT_1564404 [Armillaria novae-zelandiae]|uniref:Uncharacterized protein n=1 Tax=Armillaria novae-zelandiae TaxID=153914 RepID=A0AA39P9V3_9AGAR|nr:hypothetical protein IW261DRAFT_1564404 [Armillaria novae-zelandiae]